jgi:LuxR family maltose regulon positive regulatory protein
MVVVNEEEFRSLPASIASARAYLAQALGDVPSTVTYARRALDLLPEGDYYERGIAAMFLGLAYWTSGDLEAAYQSLADSVASLHMAGNIYFQIVGTVFLADIRVVQGRLQEAESTYEQALQLAAEQGEPVLQETADLYVGLSELHRERGDLKAATQHLLRGKELGEQAVSPGSKYRLCAAMARIKVAQGDLEAALDLLHEAKRLYKRDAMPDVRPIAALKTWVWVRQGRLTEALGWARERGLSVDDELSYLGEFEHIILARVLIAEYKSDRAERSALQAIGLLERLLKAAEEGRRMGSVINILALQALAHQARGDIPLALAALERALTLAEPEGYVRIFVDEGLPMEALLKKMRLEDGRMRKYVYKLLAAFSDKESPPLSPSPQPLIDPLSKRECEVLRLLTTELSGPEIAQELMVSMNTIRTHTKNIYSKLGVNSRRDAVRQAKEPKLM